MVPASYPANTKHDGFVMVSGGSRSVLVNGLLLLTVLSPVQTKSIFLVSTPSAFGVTMIERSVAENPHRVATVDFRDFRFLSSNLAPRSA